MMDRNTKTRLSMSAAAAAVALALGTSFAQAQQPRSAEQDRQSAQQTREAAERAEDRAERAEDRAEAAQDRADDRSRAARERAEDDAEDVLQDRSDDQRRAQSSTSSRRGAGSGGDLEDLADDYDDLSTFTRALQTAGLIDSLSDGTNYTIFAPTDEAFESMRGDTEDLLSAENRDELVALLRAHIVADDVDSTRARQLEEARTLDGGTVELKMEDGKLMVGDATVVQSDIERGNVRIHTIDEVLEPTRTAALDRDQRELR